MQRFVPLFGIAAFLSIFFVIQKLNAQPYTYDFLTKPVTQEDGDTISTSQISVSSNTATLITSSEPVTSLGAGNPNRSYRKRTIQNTSPYTVYIGSVTSGTSLVSVGYVLTASTFSSYTSVYQTYNKAAFWGTCAPSATIATCVVTVILESNSIP